MNTIIHGDCLEKLKDLQADSVDLLCTDPPYGYSFMGKDWDKAVPSVEIWKECLRVLKPGAFAFIMSAPRQDVLSQMIVRIGEAGFDTDFTSIYWTYASGFPKAANIGKMVDKRSKRHGGGSSHIFPERNNKTGSVGTSPLEGSYGGFQPKPAVEVIIVAMKPLSEKTFVDQALKNGKGITWLDDCRVPLAQIQPHKPWRASKSASTSGASFKGGSFGEQDSRGRFPANLLVSDDVLNDGRVIKAAPGGMTKFGGGFGNGKDVKSDSRYFDLDAWAKTLPFLICPKASKGEKNGGLNGFQKITVGDGRHVPVDNAFQRGKTQRLNIHPTVKPLKLMSYLITLGSRPGDMVLDPFVGSGTTAIAAKQLDRRYIGIEREKEYVEIAESRLDSIPNSLFQ